MKIFMFALDEKSKIVYRSISPYVADGDYREYVRQWVAEYKRKPRLTLKPLYIVKVYPKPAKYEDQFIF